MKKKNYIRPNISVVRFKQSVALLAGSDNFRTSVSLDEVYNDDDID